MNKEVKIIIWFSRLLRWSLGIFLLLLVVYMQVKAAGLPFYSAH